MKISSVIWIAGVLAAVLARQCYAQLSGCDDFNDNSTDTNRWGLDMHPSGQGCGGLLTETNGRLEFTKTSGCADRDLVLRPWILNFGSYTQDWEVQINVSVPNPGFEESTFGLVVVSGTNADFENLDSFSKLQLSLFQSATPSRHFLMRVGVKGSTDFPRVAEVDTASTFAGLRVAFDASTKVLSTFYDEDGPNNGYTWTILGSTNISTAWNMTSTNVFGILVFGRAETTNAADVVVSTDNLFGDNFCASTAPRPMLWIDLVGTNVVLSWSTNTPSYQLQSANGLEPPVGWQSVGTAPGIVGTNFTVTNAVSSGKVFYRLCK